MKWQKGKNIYNVSNKITKIPIKINLLNFTKINDSFFFFVKSFYQEFFFSLEILSFGILVDVGPRIIVELSVVHKTYFLLLFYVNVKYT